MGIDLHDPDTRRGGPPGLVAEDACRECDEQQQYDAQGKHLRRDL